MHNARDKIAAWLENNQDKWLTQSFQSISKEIGVSASSVDRYLPELIADRDDILPSQVLKMREEAGFTSPRKSKADLNMVREVIKKYPDAPVRDIAYLAKCTPKVVQKVQKEIEQENQNTDNDREISDIDAEIEKLKEQRSKLSRSKI